MALSALDDRDAPPTTADLERVLGDGALWHALVAWVVARWGPSLGEWSYSGARYGWSHRVRKGKRTIVYLIPQEGHFLAGVVLGDRALAAARERGLRPDVLQSLAEARRYAEGTGLRLPVRCFDDLEQVEALLEAKMAP